MDYAVEPKDIVDLGQRLLAVAKEQMCLAQYLLSKAVARSPAWATWFSILTGMVGATHCLTHARALLNAQRGLDLIGDQTLRMLASLEKGEAPTHDVERGELDGWMSGYYLNGAQHRIVATFEMMLRTVYRPRPNTTRKALIERARHELEPRFPAFVARNVAEWDKYEGLKGTRFQYEFGDVTPGAVLARLTFQVDDIKHRAYPSVDDAPVPCRWRDGVIGIETVTQLFARYVDSGAASLPGRRSS